MIKFEFEGREFEFKGAYQLPKHGVYFLESMGSRVLCQGKAGVLTGGVRAIVHLVEKYHDFGGVRFKETGEARKPQTGEWVFYNDNVILINFVGYHKYIILEPVEVLKDADEATV